MINNKGEHLDYLYKVRDGKLEKGLGIGCDLDDFLRWKKGQMNVLLGHDNVGKTFWFTFYALCLSLKHEIKWCIYSGENSTGQIIRDMIVMLSGSDLTELSYNEILRYSNRIEMYFDFVDNKKQYTPHELLEVFKQSDADSCFIDPITALNRSFQYSDTYEFLNDCRHFCNTTNKSVYICTHPVTESGRSGNLYPKGHQWENHIKPCLKSHCEGGKPYSNRSDDMIICHRLTSHPDMRYYTMIDIAKVRDTSTGGKQTNMNEPLLFEYNYGKGFLIGGKDPLKEYRGLKTKELWTK
tara:strand:+ start:3061 stop:3948 length:888 start_codon:yes stop_codon:yes gene_type:complete